jgi:hypothetical protein
VIFSLKKGILQHIGEDGMKKMDTRLHKIEPIKGDSQRIGTPLEEVDSHTKNLRSL